MSPFRKMNASAVPNITQLRKLLDYGHSHDSRDIKFWNEARSYPFTFVSSRDIPGQELIKWADQTHQSGLSEMTHKFLELEGNGLEFWPGDSGHKNYRKLQYSKDAPRIKRLVLQLFFRLNQQARWKGSHIGRANRTLPETEEAENSSSAAGANISPPSLDNEPGRDNSVSSQRGSSRSSADRRGFDRGNPIDLDEQPGEGLPPIPTLVSSAWAAAGTQSPDPFESYTYGSFRPVSREDEKKASTRLSISEQDNLIHEQQPAIPTAPVAPVAAMEDPYDGPNSSRATTPDAVLPEPSSAKRAAPSDQDENDLQAKRSRSRPSAPETPREVGAEASGSPAGIDTGSRVRRQRNPPVAPGIVRGAEYNNALDRLPRRSSTPGSVSEGDNSQSLYEPTELIPSPPRDLQHNATHANGDIPLASTEHQLTPIFKYGGKQETMQQVPRILPRVNIIYSVMVSNMLNKRWTPQGGFQPMRLVELVEELPVTYTFEVLTFSLETPGGPKYEETVAVGDEGGFAEMKTRFREKVVSCRQSHVGSSRVLNFEIVITPLRHDEGHHHQDIGEEDDFDL
ncbi:hypothetical protein BGZ63DRAFT_370929 [Mariannaea sp. PMI_226]|nr:hypothetical protein BGZ63DRAFT_370929 [Mariannaea sp. PMI_226]